MTVGVGVPLRMNPVALDDGRPVWNSAKAFVLTVAGGSSGFGNFFRLPLMFVSFGVGNFMIAYWVSLIFVAYPLAVLETFLGHHHRKASAGTMAQVHPRAVGLGYAMPLFGSVLIAVYSSALLSWTAYPFLIESFAEKAPYDFPTPERTRDYWYNRATFHDSNFIVFVVLAAVWTLSCLIAARGIRSVMVAVYFTVPLPLLYLLGLMVYAVVVANGASLGSALTPSVSGVFNLAVWGNAMGQALLTLQAATGNLIAFGSFCRPVHNTFNIASVVLVQGILVSLAFGITTACALTLLDWSKLDDAGYGSGFFVPLGVYASLLSRSSTSGPLAIFFFACVLVLGIEMLATAVQVLYSIAWDFAVSLRGRKLGVLIGFALSLLSAPLMLAGSYHYITAIDQAIVAVILPFLAACECVVVGYFWAEKSIVRTLAERAVPSGCSRVTAFLSIAYHQSVGRIKELVEKQGRSSTVASVLPFFVKFLVPAACIAACVCSGISLYRMVDQLGVGPVVTAYVLMIVAVLYILVHAVMAQAKHVALPWTDDVTMGAVDTMGSPSPSRPPLVVDTLELRPC
jgi:SNF family Na+-dependent transporter